MKSAIAELILKALSHNKINNIPPSLKTCYGCSGLYISNDGSQIESVGWCCYNCLKRVSNNL